MYFTRIHKNKDIIENILVTIMSGGVWKHRNIENILWVILKVYIIQDRTRYEQYLEVSNVRTVWHFLIINLFAWWVTQRVHTLFPTKNLKAIKSLLYLKSYITYRAYWDDILNMLMFVNVRCISFNLDIIRCTFVETVAEEAIYFEYQVPEWELEVLIIFIIVN